MDLSSVNARDMYDNAYDLVDKMWYEGADIGVNWDEDWKLVNMLIGGNDLCRFCDDEVRPYLISKHYYLRRHI